MALWAVGAVINVIGSILINLGTNVIKLGHTRTAALADGPQPKLLRAPRRWWRTPGNKMWLSGMAAFGVGNLLNFASFAFAAQSLLSALGVVQFISNIIFGRFVNKEKVTKRVLLATAIVCCGCVLLVAFGNHESPTLSTHDLLELYSKPPYIAYLCFIFTCAPVMYGVYRHGKRAVLADHSGAAARKWARWLPISYALFAGVLGTQSVLYGKTMSMLLRTTFSGDSQFKSWYMYVSIFLFLLFAGFWMRRYSKAMKLFPVLIIMPIIQIVWVLFSLISGSLYYEEYKTLNALSGSMFGLGVVVLLVGVHLLTGGKQPVQQPPQRETKASELGLTEEEQERAGELDQEALRSKAPLSDTLDGEVEVSTAADVLEPEEALVARKLSNVYERKSAQSGHSLGSAAVAAAGARPASAPAARAAAGRWPSPDEGSASEESSSAPVLAAVHDSTSPAASPWPAANGAAARGPSGRSPAAKGAALSEVLVSTHTEDSDSEAATGGAAIPGAGAARPASAAAAALGGSPPPASLMHDLRSDWGVSMSDLNAVVRASVGLPQDDEEGTAFSIWSMPMPVSASFTSQGRVRSVDLQRATFRIRSAFEQQLAGGGTGSGGGLTGLVRMPATTDELYPPGSLSGARVGRPGHRRINRSRSANELDDMLRAAALGSDADLAGPTPRLAGERDIESLGSPWLAASTATAGAAGAAAGAAPAGEEVSSQRVPGPTAEVQLARHWRHPSPSAPALSALHLDGGGPAGLSTPPAIPPAAGGSVQMPSAPGSAPRRPWSVEPGVGVSPAFSQASNIVDESEGQGAGSPVPAQREGAIPVSDFLSSMSMSMSFSPPGSEGNMALAARARQQAGKKGDKAS
ncbi:hypothetical protein ABPG75_006232 [Micractinium tetrahymenae]